MANGFAENLERYLNSQTLDLPPPLSVEALAQQLSVWLTQHEGATFNLYFGSMAGQSLYAVSLYPERSVVISGHFVPDDLLRRFVEGNQDLLADPRHSIGIWYSAALEAIYLDVSATLPDQQEAIALGERYNQEAIYDLARDEVIDTGGSGEEREGWLPERDRLPPLHRLPNVRQSDE